MHFCICILCIWVLFPSAALADSSPAASIDADCLRESYGDSLPAALVSDALVRESMAQVYPLEPQRPDPSEGQHPGRVRSYAFLRHLYGANKAEVQAQLRSVGLLGDRVMLSAPAAQAFSRVALALEALVQEKPHLRSYIVPVGGFVWRFIAGEERLSPHSFGIAVDLNPAKGPYWRWAGPQKRSYQGPMARAQYPSEIVAAFEQQGFIWGGKWYEYDLMHFEYRPELICKSKILQKRHFSGEAAPLLLPALQP